MPDITCPTCHTPRSVNHFHCAGCHRTFSGLSGFDSHRRQEGNLRVCVDPAEIRTEHGAPRLVLKDGVWRTPERELQQAA